VPVSSLMAAHLLPINVLVANMGRRIEAYRLSRNLRQSDLAEMTGLSPSTILRIEQGKGGTIDTLVRILQALDCADRIELVVPVAGLNPLDPMVRTGRQRRRARPVPEPEYNEPWTWGDDT
jgi:transcriptional regulator with XRE-family HTH domain